MQNLALMIIDECHHAVKVGRSLKMILDFGYKIRLHFNLDIFAGLATKTFCGAHGVDDWRADRWKQEMSGCQVMVMIHQVLLDALSREYIR